MVAADRVDRICSLERSLATSAGEKMRLVFVICLSLAGVATAQSPEQPMSHHMGSKPVLLTPSDLKWTPAPPETGIPSAVQMTVLSGEPSKTGLFAIRLKIPDGG